MANYLVTDSDLTSVADAIREKGGTSAQLEFPTGFVDAVEAIETGGGDSPMYELTFPRTEMTYISYKYEIRKSHVKITRVTDQESSLVVNLTDLPPISDKNREEWFEIPTGTAVLKISNVVNPSNIEWAANFRLANSSTSAQFSTGNSTHTSGETVTVSVTTPVSIGCFFIYIADTPTVGAVLEFDVEFSVNGTRYI